MKQPKITGHMIVQNEEQWVWYAIHSVLPFVEKLFIYDTGSTDKTVSLISSIKSKKISFQKKGKVTPFELVTLRNEQLQKTTTGWFFLLDGDEVWSRESFCEQIALIQTVSDNVMGIVVPTYQCVGDIFHLQDNSAGKYRFFGTEGHFNIRMYRKRKGFSWIGRYPLEAYCNQEKEPIQNNEKQLLLAKNGYFHMSRMYRSSVDTHAKKAVEQGYLHCKLLPEVFFETRPLFVSSPWISFSPTEKYKVFFRTPILRLKRLIQAL